MATRSGSSLSPQQAAYVLDQALADRKLSRTDVNRYLQGLQREIADIETRLAELRNLGPSAGGGARRRPGRPAGAKRRARRGRRPGRPAGAKRRGGKAVSAETKKSRQIQGRYLGLLRQVPERERGKFKKIAQNDSREKAIEALAKRLGK